MTPSNLPLCYCMNVHPMQTLAAVEAALDQFTVPVMKRVGEPMAAGLWLSRPVLDEVLKNPEHLAAGLKHRGLSCHTFNAFPYGQFHGERVKEQVYLPDWSDPLRLQYTEECAKVLAHLLQDGAEGTISTVPLGFKALPHGADFRARCIAQLIELSRRLAEIRNRTGKTIRLAIEPEPLCVIETTDEAIDFFDRLYQAAHAAGELESVRQHLGLCYDICHQAVEFEDIDLSIRKLDAKGIRINKIHITAAIELNRPADNAAARQALAEFVEPRYLHQTLARLPDGSVVRFTDLTKDFCAKPEAAFAAADCWRIHYHVPVNAASMGLLGTTKPQIDQALAAAAKLDYAPHLEVETYTWGVMPGGKSVDLVEAMSLEILEARRMITRTASGGR